MPERQRDENTEAERAVRKITDSERDKGEDLLGSEDLKRQLREAKARERDTLSPQSPRKSGV